MYTDIFYERTSFENYADNNTAFSALSSCYKFKYF